MTGVQTCALPILLRLDDRNVLGLMPAYLASRKVAGVKALIVFQQNYLKGISSHQGQVLVFDAETGIRTAAASAAVTKALARPGACRVGVISKPSVWCATCGR